MIVVDIGNSGLRAASVLSPGLSDSSQQASDGMPSLGRVFKLSWSAVGHSIHKAQPQRIERSGERWSQLGDREALEWIVDQCDSEHVGVWRIASVNRSVMDSLCQCIRSKHPRARIEPIRAGDVGLEIDVLYPDRVGIDRLLAARAALRIVRRGDSEQTPIIVVQAGTALTIDWVTERDCFAGGAILPGVGLALQVLAAGTDQLPWLPTDSITDFPALPGKSTDQAIAAGVHASVVGGARFLIERYRQGRAIPVVISGGDGKLLRSVIEGPVQVVENLVLLGLALSPNS